ATMAFESARFPVAGSRTKYFRALSKPYFRRNAVRPRLRNSPRALSTADRVISCSVPNADPSSGGCAIFGGWRDCIALSYEAKASGECLTNATREAACKMCCGSHVQIANAEHAESLPLPGRHELGWRSSSVLALTASRIRRLAR